jgi:hypothetical protein
LCISGLTTGTARQHSVEVSHIEFEENQPNGTGGDSTSQSDMHDLHNKTLLFIYKDHLTAWQPAQPLSSDSSYFVL